MVFNDEINDNQHLSIGIMSVKPLFEDRLLYEECLSRVSGQRRSKAKKLKIYDDRCRSVGAAVLLNVMVGENITRNRSDGSMISDTTESANDRNSGHELNVYDIQKAVGMVNPDYNFPVRYGENGKPEFDIERDIYYNMAHSGEYVACAVADTPVGIDIDGSRNADLKIAKRFFTQEECDMINSSSDFFKIWTFKEAYGKYTGKGVVPALGISEASLENHTDKRINVYHYEYGSYRICVVL